MRLHFCNSAFSTGSRCRGCALEGPSACPRCLPSDLLDQKIGAAGGKLPFCAKPRSLAKSPDVLRTHRMIRERCCQVRTPVISIRMIKEYAGRGELIAGGGSNSHAQNCLAMPACFRTAFAVWRDLMSWSTGKRRCVIALYQISWSPRPARSKWQPCVRRISFSFGV